MVYCFYCCTCHHNQSVFFAARPIPQPMAQLKYGALVSASVEMMPRCRHNHLMFFGQMANRLRNRLAALVCPNFLLRYAYHNYPIIWSDHSLKFFTDSSLHAFTMGVFSHTSASQQHPGLKDRPQMLSMPEADFVTGFNVVWQLPGYGAPQAREVVKLARWMGDPETHELYMNSSLAVTLQKYCKTCFYPGWFGTRTLVGEVA